MSSITRQNSNARLSRIVTHGDTVYIAGVTSAIEGDIVAQTRNALEKIDGYLADAGTDKHHLLAVQIWLKDIDADFDGMNRAWTEWAPADALPARATCEAKLARPHLLVEIIVTAARK